MYDPTTPLTGEQVLRVFRAITGRTVRGVKIEGMVEFNRLLGYKWDTSTYRIFKRKVLGRALSAKIVLAVGERLVADILNKPEFREPKLPHEK